MVRDFGLDPDDDGREQAYVFHAAPAGTMSSVVMSVRMRGNPAPLAARLPVIAATVDARLLVQEAQPLNEWVRQRDMSLIVTVGAQVAVTALVLFLSALGIFSLVSISVSRRTREIGLRAALGANPRNLLAGILSRAVVLMGSGITAGGALLLLSVALGQGPSGRPAQDRPAIRRLSWNDIRRHARRVPACLHRARRPRTQDQSHRSPEGGLSSG